MDSVWQSRIEEHCFVGSRIFPRLRFSYHVHCTTFVKYALVSQGGDPRPPSSRRGKAGRSHLNGEITPVLPTGIGERFSKTISNLGHAALLR
jgi:hypothetical protein